MERLSKYGVIVRGIVRKQVEHLQAITGGHYGFAWSMEGWTNGQVTEAREMFNDILSRLDPDNKHKPPDE